MSPSYVTCSECGKRALSIATRCPQCGFEFPARTLPRKSGTSNFGRLLPLLAAAGAVAATVALVTMVMRRTANRAEAPATAEAPGTATAPDMDTAMAASSPAPGAAQRRFARTWTNVRSRRSAAGDVVGVLLPGDTVLADSLSRGWWRVTFEGKVMGYAYRSTLVTDPPQVGP
jgi:SH3 domain-containing protein